MCTDTYQKIIDTKGIQEDTARIRSNVSILINNASDWDIKRSKNE